MRKYLLAVLALVVAGGYIVSPAYAQNQNTPGSPVMQVGQRGDAAQFCDSASDANLTLRAPGPGQSDYLVSLTSVSVASAAPTAATPTLTTATGIAGSSPSFMAVASKFPAAGAQGSVWQTSYPMSTPIKGAQGVSVVIVKSTNVTNFPTTYEVCYFIAP